MRQNNYPLHIFLFLVSVFTTLLAGAELATGHSFFYGTERLGFGDLAKGISFSACFLLFLTVHEFGHYFTAMYHKVRCSLPFYIPIFIPFSPFNIGSFGAVIRIRQVPPSRRIYFDIGVAGPLAGFVVSLGLLVYGLMTLPPMESTVLAIHPEYQQMFGGVPSIEQIRTVQVPVGVGSNLLFWIMTQILPMDRAQLPPAFELMHYPVVFLGYLTCFFTALNLLPIGQLDGGHVTYGLFGRRIAGRVSRIAILALLVMGGTGVMRLEAYDQNLFQDMFWYVVDQAGEMVLCIGLYGYVLSRLFKHLGWPKVLGLALALGGFQFFFNLLLMPVESNPIWLVYAFLAVRVLGVDHPEALDDEPLTLRQRLLGYLSMLIFVLCFSPSPLVLMGN